MNSVETDKPKDVKKIRNLIKKYKNKSSDMNNNISLESNIMKTFISSKLTEYNEYR